MPSLSGNLVDVTSAPSDATEVWIRAADGRVSGANVVLEETRRVPVNAGTFTVNVLPGRAHLVVIHAGMSQEHVPLLVQDGMTTIAEAVRLGSEGWGEYSPSQAEQIKAEIAAEVAKAAASAQAAKNAQQAAEQARTDTQNALSTKADKVHTHTTAQVTGLDAALAGKATTTALGVVDTRVTALSNRTPTVAGITGVYPSGTGAVNVSLNSANAGAWFYYGDQIKIPAGKWLVKIIGVPNAAARFYITPTAWIDYTGTMEAVITTDGSSLSRFWAQSGNEVVGKEVNAIFTRITIPTQ